jgi:hypothetical protein
MWQWSAHAQSNVEAHVVHQRLLGGGLHLFRAFCLCSVKRAVGFGWVMELTRAPAKCMTDGWASLGGLCMVCVSSTYPSGLVSACPVPRAGTGWGDMHSACSRMRNGLLSQLQRLGGTHDALGVSAPVECGGLHPGQFLRMVLLRLCWVQLGDGAYQGAN